MKTIELFNGLHVKEVVMPSKRIIFNSDSKADDLFFIGHGLVKIKDVSGKIVHCYTSGDFIGEEVIFGNNRYTHTAITQQKTKLYRLEEKLISISSLQENGLYYHILDTINERRLEKEQMLESLVFKSVKERIAMFISFLAKETGQEIGENMYEILSFFTYSELADLTFTTRQTVTRIMQEFIKSSYCSKGSNHSFVVNKEFFKAFESVQ